MNIEVVNYGSGGGNNDQVAKHGDGNCDEGGCEMSIGPSMSMKERACYLVWQDLRVMLPSSGDGPTKRLLHGLNGFAEPGRIMAIMGPSGSGKSTLLDALAGRLAKNVVMTGNILLNGEKKNLSYGAVAYVTQEDVLMGTLSVRETITYSANLRLPSTLSKEEINDTIEGTIMEMGLEDCADRLVGNWHLRGISGGEKKRLSIALEILVRPRLLFLDEPTSGLDSASAFFVAHALKSVARDGRTVISSIHQPSSEVFALFDDLFLLSGGQTVYFGESKEAIEMESMNVENLSSDESQGRDKRKSPAVVEIQTAKKKSKTTSSNNNKGSKKTGASKNPRASKKPSVWVDFEKFEDEDEKQKARCKHCSAELAADPRLNGTSALRRHVLRCEKHPDYMKNQSNIFLKKNDDDEGGTCEVKSWKFSVEACDRAITEMVILDELPFSFVERVGFRRFLQTMNPNYKAPSRTTVGRNTGNIYLEEKAKLKSFFANSNRRICLTTDTWTSIQNINYMSLTAHFIDDNWVLHKRIINFKDITSHKGEDIGRALIQCLKEWDIKNILTITADNASANNTAMEFIKGRLDNLLGDGIYLQVRCMAHIINLIVKDGLRDGATPIERIRNAIRYIRHSPKRLDAFKKCVKAERIESKALLCLDMPTRWNSTYEMLDRAEKFEKAFEAFDLAYPNFKNDLGDGLPKITDWSYARKIRDLLELFKLKTTNASATKHVTVNMFYSEIMDIYGHLTKMRGIDIESRLMADKMQDKFDKYWGTSNKGFNYILYFAAILDPRLKLRVLSFGFEGLFRAENRKETEDQLKKRIETAVKFVTNELEIVFKHYELNSERPSLSQASQRASNVERSIHGSSGFFAQFKSAGGSSSYETKTELQKYLEDIEEPDYERFDILQWWKASSSKYPIVAKMAKDILAIPVSSVASESAFSTGGRVVEPYRSSLAPSLVEALICTEDWIGMSSKKIINESPTDFDDIGKEICEKAEPSNMNPEVK